MLSDTVRLHLFHRNPEVLSCLIASAISCGALAKLMTAPILPRVLGFTLAGVALKLGCPVGHNTTVSEHFLSSERMRRSTNIPVRVCTTSSISSIAKKDETSLLVKWLQISPGLSGGINPILGKEGLEPCFPFLRVDE